MALSIPNDQLMAGDIVEFIIDPQTANQTLIDLGVHKIKSDLAAEAWYDYQGSEWRTIDGRRYLSIYVQVRRYPRGMPPSMASGFAPVAVVVVSLAALAAIVAVATAVSKMREVAAGVRRDQAIVVIATDPSLTKEQKDRYIAALNAPVTGSTGLGAGVAALGGGLMTAAIIIGVIWALSESERR